MLFREFHNEDRTPIDHKVMQLYLGTNMSIGEISQTVGKSIGEIYRIIHRNGGPSRRRADRSMFVQELLKHNVRKDVISKLTGYSMRHINRIAKK